MRVRTALVAPLPREGVAIGAIYIRRKEVRPFSDKQIKVHRVLVWVEFWVETGSNPHGNWL
jgi:hypothetical protein